jgi:hypothetical protein
MWPLFRRWLSPPIILTLILLSSSAAAQSQAGSQRPRRLLAAYDLPSRRAPPAVVSLDDLLAGLDLSGEPKSVEVHVKPGDSQRAAVVVSSCCSVQCTAAAAWVAPPHSCTLITHQQPSRSI